MTLKSERPPRSQLRGQRGAGDISVAGNYRGLPRAEPICQYRYHHGTGEPTTDAVPSSIVDVAMLAPDFRKRLLISVGVFPRSTREDVASSELHQQNEGYMHDAPGNARGKSKFHGHMRCGEFPAIQLRALATCRAPSYTCP